MEEKHNYRREKVYLTLSEESAKLFDLPELADKKLPYLYEWRLYDNNRCVLIERCCGFETEINEGSQKLADSTDESFFSRMSSYIDAHKYFNPVLWIAERLHPLKVKDEF